MEQALKDLNLSSQEADRITHAFKDPQFGQLLGDYMRSLADPQTKREAGEYLRQLEQEGALPEALGQGVVVVAPVPALVIKSADKATGSKVFVNICTADKVATARSERAKDAATGQGGMRWDFPYVLGRVRDGKDKQGHHCCVYDATVHPATVQAAAAHQGVKDLLIDAILDGIEGQEGCRLSRRYSCPKMRYKCTEGVSKPLLVTMRAAASSGAAQSRRQHPGIQVLSSAEGGSGGSSSHSKPAARSAFNFPLPPRAAKQPQQQRQHGLPGAAADKPSGSTGWGGEQQPHYVVVHRGHTDISDAWGGAGNQLLQHSSRPKELVVRVELPGVESSMDISVGLPAESQQLCLAVPGKYRLELQLPFPVDQGASPKWDQAKHMLEIVLPVAQPPVLRAGSSGEGCAGTSSAGAGGGNDAQPAPGPAPSTMPASLNARTSVAGSSAACGRAISRPAEVGQEQQLPGSGALLAGPQQRAAAEAESTASGLRSSYNGAYSSQPAQGGGAQGPEAAGRGTAAPHLTCSLVDDLD